MLASLSVAATYLDAISTVLERGSDVAPVVDSRSPATRFGNARRRTREVLAYTVRIDSEAGLLPYSPGRRTRVAYAVALLNWTLSGSQDASAISHYNTRAASFSDSPSEFSASFGSRLFNDPSDQIHDVVQRLHGDPASRRAIAVISRPTDAARPSRETPCAVSCHFLVREGRLVALTQMRSQSALMVFPYDLFVFLGIQRHVARCLDLPTGDHFWFANSLHIYDDELDLANRVIHDSIDSIKFPHLSTRPDDSAQLADRERSIREAVHTSDFRYMEKLSRVVDPTDTYEGVAGAVLMADAWHRLGAIDRATDFAARLPKALEAALIEEWEAPV